VGNGPVPPAQFERDVWPAIFDAASGESFNLAVDG
jgi:hypothetical protein